MRLWNSLTATSGLDSQPCCSAIQDGISRLQWIPGSSFSQKMIWWHVICWSVMGMISRNGDRPCFVCDCMYGCLYLEIKALFQCNIYLIRYRDFPYKDKAISWPCYLCTGSSYTGKVACYRKISNIRCTELPNLNVSRLVLQLSLLNPMKPGVKSRMKM